MPLRDSFTREIIPGSKPPRKYARGIHGGIDIGWVEGALVRAPRKGVVYVAGRVSGLSALGNQVLFRFRTWYGGTRYIRMCHLNTIKVKVGQTLYQGQVVGTLGMTGQTTGPHVHFELSKSRNWSNAGALENPYKLLEQARKAD